MSDTVTITVEFSGGLEMLFDHVTKHELTLSKHAADTDGKAPTVGYLVKYICDQLMKDSRKELFVLDGAVRPGILVLINDSDWELEGEHEYELQNRDNILFVSTLHGG
ncbi:ubiquitin-like modifier 1 [Capronia epimyces CBS 606.96]|uniref:Ubiquitin-related modifier 1 n=1 Tax=Capronia epimyces CBS 606.96 TaxID=1182542 RepID=W9XQN3_9EURO|nr:ubiquitin-like modifier 1 [Capronia epimyces CBS 606.96]EXJ79645.1 ubiquitin-like modifier 1 [Capronia epimyces CBS 606.96]